jgi:predicted TIM-barrel enzyme
LPNCGSVLELPSLRSTEPERLGRDAFLARLRGVADAGQAVIGAGAGNGLVSKAAAAGGADFIAVYCTSRARHRGLPTSIVGDPNTITLEQVEEVAAVVRDVPIVAGLHATDPTRHVSPLLARLRDLGCSGVINYPSMGLYGREYIGGPVGYDDGLEIEREALAAAKEDGLVAMTYVYRPSEAEFFAPVADVIVAHAGWTVGGMSGAPESLGMDEAAQAVEEQIAAGRAAGGDDVIYLGHGGPFSAPADTAELYRRTSAQGFVGASSVERIPVERAVAAVVEEFKAVPVGPKGGM